MGREKENQEKGKIISGREKKQVQRSEEKTGEKKREDQEGEAEVRGKGREKRIWRRQALCLHPKRQTEAQIWPPNSSQYYPHGV